MAHQRLHRGADQETESLGAAFLGADMDVTRRNLIHLLGIAPAVAAAQTQAEHTHTAPPAPEPAKKVYQRKVFDDHQWRSVQVLCDLIIPADENSGDRKSTRLNSSHLGISYA